GVQHLKSGVPWSESGMNESKGCGTAMRSAPIGLAYPHAIDALTNMSSRISKMTHGHPCATAGSFATAFLVAKSLDGTSTDDLLEELIQRSSRISEEFSRHMTKISEALNTSDSRVAHGLLGKGWVAEEAVAGAIYANIKHPESFRDCILEAANSGGDTDSKACIAGAIAGTRLGVHAIPSGWIEGIENRDLLVQLANQLLRIQKDLEQL
ncbi:MAG: ADP-ribosylglycohydrolase family protein, partial [Candidatus Thorarchaeota archaeon]|nr:ADP-ribosylglycohydrolase family protein [Candidatus Thorarchaeota archaeon]